MANQSVRTLLAPTIHDVSKRDFDQLASADCGAAIVAMKRKARCETDAELAVFLHKHRTAVAQWRRRGMVPESALLRLLILTEGGRAA